MTVQKTIIEGISELLFTNDYVVVPGFGGFIARQQLAHYSVGKGSLYPPSKKVMFNVQLKQNDGILAGWLKEKLNCDFAEAGRHLNDFAAYSNMLLETRRRLEFESLGLFYLDFENNICFEPKADVNFLIDSFGLSSVTLRELEPEKAQPKPVIETKDRVVTPEMEQDKVQVPVRRNYKRIAVLAVGLPLFGVALLFAAARMQPNSNFMAGIFGSGNEALYSPVNYSSNITEITAKAAEPYLVDANGYAGLNLLSENKTTVVDISAVKTESKTLRPSSFSHHASFSGKYQVVLGCFSITQNADRLVSKLAKQNIHAVVSGTNAKGLHVVSAGGFDTRENATALLMHIKDKCPSAWVMAN